MSTQLSWRKRRSLAIALRRGQAIPVNLRDDASEVIRTFKVYGLVSWGWGVLAIGWLLIAYFSEGGLRWGYLVLAVLTFGSSYFQVKWRMRILSREAEFARPSPL
jgi:hypothetical protein